MQNDEPTKSFVPLTKGTEVGQYCIIKKIDEGGMGEVYLAEDTKLNNKVALKFLASRFVSDESSRTRFTREAQAAASLDHPNIVAILELNEFKGRPYFAMQYVQGQSLWRYAKNEKLSIDRIVELAMQLCEGLQAAHEKGITHRDIKPSNILIDSHGRLRIVDFGLASVQGTDRLTKTGSTLGTVGYMSPEQMRGEKVDHRSDLFSMGVVLYELLSGLNPFKAESEAATMHAITQDNPQPLARFNREVPDELQRIIDKALAKDVSLRYQHADGMLSDLKRLGLAEKSHTIGVGKWAIASTTVLILILAGYILYSNYLVAPEGSESQPKRIAVLPLENLGSADDEYFADGITDEIISRLARMKDLHVISRTSSMQYKNSQMSLPEIASELNVDYILEGTIRWDHSGETSRVRITPQLIQVSDDRHLWASNYERTLTQIFAVQSDIAINIVEALGVTLLEPERAVFERPATKSLEAYNSYLRALELSSQPNYSRNHLQLTIDMLERAVKLDPEFAVAYALLSQIHSRFFHWVGDQTEERLRKAKSAVDRALELQPELPEAHLALGKYYYEGDRDYERARQEYLRAERGLPNDSRVIHLLGVLHKRQGEFERGIDFFKRGLELNPRHAMLAIEVGVSYHFLRQYAEAERFYELGIALAPDQYIGYWHKFFLYSKSLGNLQSAREMLQQNPVISESWSMLFELELLERNYKAALQRLASLPEVSQELQSHEARTLKAGLIYSFMGEQERSRVAFDSARTLLEEKIEEFPDDNGIHASLGIAYAGLGRNEEALFHGERAVELLPISMDAFDGPTYEQNLARIYILLGEQDAALDKIDYLLSIPSAWMSVGALRIDPTWDPLRDHPRFQALLEKYDTGK